MANEYAITSYTGTIRSSVGSAAQDIEAHIESVAQTGTINATGIVTIGDGKYFQGWVLHQ